VTDHEHEMEETTVITMVDDEGAEQDFELLDMLEVDGKQYGVFAPLEDEEEAAATPGEEEEEGILILRVVADGDEEAYEMIDDEKEFERVVAVIEKKAEEAQAHFGVSVNNN
jgi:uncharacterized protein YrzB (UPF0473 family)